MRNYWGLSILLSCLCSMNATSWKDNYCNKQNRNIKFGLTAFFLLGVTLAGGVLYDIEQEEALDHSEMGKGNFTFEWAKPPRSEKTLFESYQNTLTYRDFYNLDFAVLPREQVAIPKDANFSGQYGQANRIGDIFKAESIVLARLKQITHGKISHLRQLAALTPKESLVLAMRIVRASIDYHLIDSDQSYSDKDRSITAVLCHGKGDCDKFSGSFSLVFDVFKMHNPKLKNVYVRSVAGKNLSDVNGRIGHSWSEIILITQDTLQYSQVDLTNQDNLGIYARYLNAGLNPSREGYLFKDNLLNNYYFFLRSTDENNGPRFDDQYLKQIKESVADLKNEELKARMNKRIKLGKLGFYEMMP